MNQRPTNPFLEHQWREEVLYLHSLWHYGNPSSNANPNPNPTLQYQPRPHFIINNHSNGNGNGNNLRASNFTSFKRENSKKTKKTTNQGRKTFKNNTINVNPNPTDNSGIEWPCEPSPEPQKPTGWPQPSSHSDATATTRSIPPKELAKYDALQLQQKSLRGSQDFFARNLDSDGDNGEEDSEEEQEEEAKNDDNEEYQFFLGVFKEDNELRRYYEKNYESGEFCCLVCGGMRKKLGKRFKNCVALVQHSTGICNTDRKKAHRAFAQVVCYVLGWDIKRLPSIVLSTSEPLGRVLAQGQGQDQEGTTKENEKLLNSGDNAGGDKKEDGQDRVVESEGTDKVDLKDGQGVFCK